MNKGIVTIKGTKEGLIFYFNTDGANMEELLQILDQKLSEGAALIGNSKYSIHEEEKLEKALLQQLEGVFAKHHMTKANIQPVVEMPKSKEAPIPEPTPGIAPMRYKANDGDSVLFRRSIRSGQTLHVEGNVIIMGDVNAGAHVMATGNIVIMGKLKGLAHAGTHGDRSAYIVAWQMEPIQIRIADMVSRSADGPGGQYMDYPETAKIEGANIVIKPYTFSKSIYHKKVIIA